MQHYAVSMIARNRQVNSLPLNNNSCGYLPLNAFFQRFGGESAYNSVRFLAVAVNDDGRGSAHVALHGSGSLLVAVDLCKGCLGLHLGCDGFVYRAEAFAVPAPWGPEIDHKNPLSCLNISRIGVGLQFAYCICHSSSGQCSSLGKLDTGYHILLAQRQNKGERLIWEF